MKNKKAISIGSFIIGSAIIWGAVILGSSFALKGTESYMEIQYILNGGAAAHLILIMAPIGAKFGKTKKENKTVKEY